MNKLEYKKRLRNGYSTLDDDELVKATGYGGMVCYSIRKKLDEIRCGSLVLKDIQLDFGDRKSTRLNSSH